MIHLNERGNLEFDTKQDLIDYVLSEHCCFDQIDSSENNQYWCSHYPDESVRKYYITVMDGDEPVIEWCCEDQTAHIF